jgi:hypothetical protein
VAVEVPAGDAGDQFNFMDDIVVPVLVGKKPVLVERRLTGRQKLALLAMAPELYRVCLTMRGYLSGQKHDPKKIVDMLDDVLNRTVPRSS